MLMVRRVWSGGNGDGRGGQGKGMVARGLRCDLHFKESQAGRIKEEICVCEDVFRHSAKSTPSIGVGGGLVVNERGLMLLMEIVYCPPLCLLGAYLPRTPPTHWDS